MAGAQTFPALDGTEPFVGAVVVAGATQGTGSFKVAPVTKREGITPFGLTVGANTLTRAMCNSDLLVSTADGNTGLYIPLLANLAGVGSYTYQFGQIELGFRVERRGLGVLAITWDSGVTVEDPLGLIDPINAGIQRWVPMHVSLVGANHWRIG